jgi:CelD/BcsL family acetyltransferase involved in cellulose biosynthesis/RimJ/RimL family protein N-acetyltransferase
MNRPHERSNEAPMTDLPRATHGARATKGADLRSPVELTVKVLRRADELVAVASEWEALAVSTGTSNPFLLPDWTLAWLEATPGLQPFVLLAYEGTRLVAVWPLTSQRQAWGRTLGYVEGDVYGVLSTRGALDGATRGFAQALAKRRDAWDVAVLSDHIVGNPDGEAITGGAEAAGLVMARLEASGYPYVDVRVEKSLDAFEKRVGKKVVNEIRRRRRQLEALAPVRVERARSLRDVHKYFPEIVELHRRRWRERSDTSGFSSDARIAGMRAAAERFAKAGRLELDLLFVDDQLIAYSYGFVFGGRHVYYSPGFDPAYAPFSASKILLHQQLVNTFADELREFDFSRGAETYKLVWATDSRVGEVLVLGHDGVRSKVAQAAVLGGLRLRSALKSNERIVHFKRETLGRWRNRVSPAYLRDGFMKAARTLARSVDDRHVVGTIRRAAERAIAPIFTRSSARLYQRRVSEPYTTPLADLSSEFEFGELGPSEYNGFADAGRHSLGEIVHNHYTGRRCYVARSRGAVVSYIWCVSGRPIWVTELGRELPLKPTDAFLYDAYTTFTFRGQGLYPRVLRHAMNSCLREGRERAWIVVSEENSASISGIEKAGFSLADSSTFESWFGKPRSK